jgi:hypothetical protein
MLLDLPTEPGVDVTEHRAHADPHIGQARDAERERIVRIEGASAAYLLKIAAWEQHDGFSMFDRPSRPNPCGFSSARTPRAKGSISRPAATISPTSICPGTRRVLAVQSWTTGLSSSRKPAKRRSIWEMSAKKVTRVALLRNLA